MKSKNLILVVCLLLLSSIGAAGDRDLLFGRGPGGGTPPKSVYKDSWAVLIAIDEYRYVPDLRYAVADAEAMKKYLTSKGGFPSRNVFTLYNDKATAANIKEMLGDILPRKAGPDDRILVFFAGHGQTDSLPGGGRMGYLIPVDGRHDKLYSTCLSMATIKETSRMIPSKHVFYIVDSCYSGIAGIETRSVPDAKPSAYLKKLVSQKAVQIVTAGQADETVIESKRFGGGHSVFIYTLLNGLEKGNADLNGDGIIPASELYSYLAPRITRDSEGRQTPKLFNMDGDGEFVFFTTPMTGPGDGKPGKGRHKSSALSAPSGMARIPGGCFQMGDHFKEGQDDELPVHKVCVSSFYMDVHEVTNAEYEACVKTGRCTAPDSKSSYTRTSYYGNNKYDNHPVIQVSWSQARDYCSWAGKRLPTETEWEYAARGGLSGKRYPHGNNTTCADACFGRYDSSLDCFGHNGLDNDTLEVEGFDPNGYGLYDMAGNVWEWVNDRYAEDYYKHCVENNIVNDPPGPRSGSHRVLRGGAWGYYTLNLRVSNRYDADPAYQGYGVGFRCAAD